MKIICYPNWMNIFIPANIDINSRIDKLALSSAKKKNLVERLNYLLSLISMHNGNSQFFKKHNGYRKISARFLRKAIGGRYYNTLKLLTDGDDPVVECDNIAIPGVVSFGYRVLKKYRTGDIITFTLSDRFSNKISKLRSKEHKALYSHYNFLITQFETHKLSFDPLVYKYIRNFYTSVIEKMKPESFRHEMLLNKIGSWINQIEDISEGKIWHNLSKRNHRLTSSVTNLPKVLRPFLLCKGQNLTEVDIKSSQPFLLSLIINNDNFFKAKEGNFILKNVYKKFYDLVKTETREDNPLLMLRTFYDEKQTKNIDAFLKSPFHDDFYSYLVTQFYSNSKINCDKEREEMKKSMMYVLFQDKFGHRNISRGVQIFKNVFPSVNEWIEQMLKFAGKSEFAYLLQRIESWFVLGNISKQFHLHLPEAPIFTIHDAILTYDQYVPEVITIARDVFLDISNREVGLKVKRPQNDPDPSVNDTEEYCMDLNRKSNAYFQKKFKHLILQSNVHAATSFLKIEL
jgi:hypothetical protein